MGSHMATDEEIFASTITDEAPSPEPEPTPAPVAPEPTEPAPGPVRDASGRFAPKSEPEPEPEAVDLKVNDHGAVPPGRFREVSERARRAEERATLLEQQMREFMATSRPAQAPQPPTQEKPDPFVRLMENPADFLGETTRPLLEPIQAEVRQLREFYSQREAVREHGQDTINAAFDAIHQAALQGDPEAQAVAARVKDPRNLDPYGELVKGHKRLQAVQRVGNDPDAWFQSNLSESLKDPAFSSRGLEMIRGQA